MLHDETMAYRIFNTVLNIVPQGTKTVVETLGRFTGEKDPGFFLAIPIIQRLRTVDMRETTIPITPQESVTHDNVRVRASGSLFVRTVSAEKLCYGARDPYSAVMTHAQSVMRTAIGKIDLDTLFRNRTILNLEIQEQLREAAEPWGLEVKRYELTDVSTDGAVAEAMDAQSIAERKRRETILAAEAQRQRDIMVSEGNKLALINEAEGDKQKQILHAEGAATAIERMSKAISTDQGERVLQFQMAERYLDSLKNGLTKTSTVFIPKDMSDITQIVSQAMAVVKTSTK